MRSGKLEKIPSYEDLSSSDSGVYSQKNDNVPSSPAVPTHLNVTKPNTVSGANQSWAVKRSRSFGTAAE